MGLGHLVYDAYLKESAVLICPLLPILYEPNIYIRHSWMQIPNVKFFFSCFFKLSLGGLYATMLAQVKSTGGKLVEIDGNKYCH